MAGELAVRQGYEVTTITPEVQDYVKAAKSESTRRANTTDWKAFIAWCGQRGLLPLPATPDTIAQYLAHMADGYKVSTIRRHLSSISQAHDAAGVENNPTRSMLVRATVKGIANTLGTAPTQKKAARSTDIRAMVAGLPGTLAGKRDRALLLVGFSGAFRRAELVSLAMEDVEYTPEGMVLSLRHSKTDQEGQGLKKAIHFGENEATCPVRALQDWLESAAITGGPIFRKVNKGGHVETSALSDKTVALVVKKAAEVAGFNPVDYAGHSLRAGCATEAAAAGAQDRDIMRQTGHKSVGMVQRYIREGNLFRNNVTANLGL